MIQYERNCFLEVTKGDRVRRNSQNARPGLPCQISHWGCWIMKAFELIKYIKTALIFVNIYDSQE
ncbi:hypothetical protein [Microcoleus sp. LEGE 07076]|uniref:hypothetical protein n=1 Tax=Microcoleus sp. LEGE 07076 TaxID=915322 RepID=UPI00187E3C8D|nr:hypothetical protein [Microcoleus sp. LEGE 07076]